MKKALYPCRIKETLTLKGGIQDHEKVSLLSRRDYTPVSPG